MKIDFNKTNDLATEVKKQLALGNFFIENNSLRVEVNIKDETQSLIIDDSINIKLVRNYSEVPSELVCGFLDKFLKQKIYDHGPKYSLINALIEYKEIYKVSGVNLRNRKLFKLFSKKENDLNIEFRNLYKAKWIDFTKQISQGNDEIFDESHLYGLWTMTLEGLKDIEEKSIEYYGNFIFVLEPLKDCLYIETDKEVVGQRFKVLLSMKLSKVKWIRKIQFWILEKIK